MSNLTEKTYDLIISNPPYVTAMAMEELPPEYRHEPRSRSPAATTGSTRCARSSRERRASSTRTGLLVVEVGHNRAGAEAAFPRLPFVWLATATATDSVFLLKREDLVGVALKLARRRCSGFDREEALGCVGTRSAGARLVVRERASAESAASVASLAAWRAATAATASTSSGRAFRIASKPGLSSR